MLVVDKSGNDTTGNGTPTNPYLTIIKANTVVATDYQWNVIKVGAGTYNESGQVTVPHGGLTFRGIGTVSLNQNLYGPQANVIFDNFTFTGDRGASVYHVESGYNSGCEIKNIIGRSVTVTRCTGTFVTNCAIDTFSTRGCYIFDSAGSIIRQLYAHDGIGSGANYCFEAESGSDDVQVWDSWGFVAKDAFIAKTSNRVQFHNCVGADQQDYAFYAKGAPGGTIQHCVANNCNYGITLNDNAGVPPFSTGWTIKNTIIMNNHIGLFIEAGSETDIVSDYNCFYGNTHIGSYNGVEYDTLAAWQLATGLDLHSVEIDPNFASTAYGGYVLPDGSPLLTAGEGGTAIGKI